MLTSIELSRCDDPAEGTSVLLNRGSPPVLATAGELNWICPACKATVVQNTCPKQLVGIVIQCSKCEVLCSVPAREPGQPVLRNSVVLPPGYVRCDGTIHALDVPSVGKSVVDAYRIETGQNLDGNPADSLYPTRYAEPSHFRAAGARLVELLGKRYEKLAASHETAKRSKTPPTTFSRMMQLIECAETSARQLEQGGPVTLNGDLLAELFITIGAFERWKAHPRWAEFVQTLSNDLEFAHSVSVLALAGVLVDYGNAVGICGIEPGGRRSDLWIDYDLKHHVRIEVKVPLLLRGPQSNIADDAAAKLIMRLVDESASTNSGQLDPTGSGVLAIGGIHLGEKNFRCIVDAAKRCLDRQKRRKPHLVAILLSDASFQYTRDAIGTMMQPIVRYERVLHPGYTGTVKLM